MKNHGYTANYDNMVVNLAQAMLAGRSLEAFLNDGGHNKQTTEFARRRTRQCIPPNKFMIAQFLNWQFVLLTSKVDGEIPTRGRDNIREKIFSWGNSTQKSSVKDCKI
jgi:hypothetical protein